jgi:hypothetical protein
MDKFLRQLGEVFIVWKRQTGRVYTTTYAIMLGDMELEVSYRFMDYTVIMKCSDGSISVRSFTFQYQLKKYLLALKEVVQ